MTAQKTTRKRWKKKTPVEVVMEQKEKLQAEVDQIESELAQKKTQLEKFEQAIRIFQTVE